MTVQDGKFIFDVKDGIFGYNTDNERGADTFHPFNSTREIGVKIIYKASYSGHYVHPILTIEDTNLYYISMGGTHNELFYNDERIAVQDFNGTNEYKYPIVISENDPNGKTGLFMISKLNKGDKLQDISDWGGITLYSIYK